MTSLDTLREALPDWAKDARLNLGSVVGNGSTLTRSQHWGVAVASAAAVGNELSLTSLVAAAREAGLTDETINAALSAFSIMAMNNVFYRGRHWCSDDVAQVPARLRMQIIANPGVDKVDFELWCLAVSAVLGCQYCVGSHEAVVRQAGMTAENVADVLRIASVVAAVGRSVAVASTLDAVSV